MLSFLFRSFTRTYVIQVYIRIIRMFNDVCFFFISDFLFLFILWQVLALLWLRVTMVFIPRELADIKNTISPNHDGDGSATGRGGGGGGALSDVKVGGLCLASWKKICCF